MADSVMDNESSSIYTYLINRLIKQEQIQVVRIVKNNKILKAN